MKHGSITQCRTLAVLLGHSMLICCTACVATADVRELRSVQMACYMYQIFMTTIGAHTHTHTHMCIDMVPYACHNDCIRLIKNSVEVLVKINCVAVKAVWRLSSFWHWEWLYFVSDWFTHVSHKLGLSWIFFLHESVSSERNFNKFRWNIEVVQLTFSQCWYQQLL
jgi:hypothetical protein